MAALIGLEETLWRLGSVDGVVVPDVVEATALFTAGRVAGRGGCNRYTGLYAVDGAALTLGPIASTRMACPGAAGTVEGAFFAALERVAGYAVDGAVLALRDADGRPLLELSAKD